MSLYGKVVALEQRLQNLEQLVIKLATHIDPQGTQFDFNQPGMFGPRNDPGYNTEVQLSYTPEEPSYKQNPFEDGMYVLAETPAPDDDFSDDDYSDGDAGDDTGEL